MNTLGRLEALLDKATRAYTTADPMVRGECYRDLCKAIAALNTEDKANG